MYRFLIGPSKREFTVHSAVVEKQSEALNTLVNNKAFREANDGCAELEEVDEEVFTSFVQYAYTGDYDFPDLGIRPVTKIDPVVQPAVAAPLECPNCSMSSYAMKKKKKLKVTEEPPPKSSSAADFDSLFWLDRPGAFWPEDGSHGAGDTAGTSGPISDTVRPLLHHARLYVFADCYQISRLAGIAHDNLEKQLDALRQKPIDRISVDATVTLLTYAYEEPRPEALRSLLVRDASRGVERLWLNWTFREVVERHAELGATLVGEMVKRLR